MPPPGVVFPYLVDEYRLSASLRHILLAAPFSWPSLSSVDVGDGMTVHWLTCVPISDAERDMVLTMGLDRFEAEMERRDIPYYDLDRPSIEV